MQEEEDEDARMASRPDLSCMSIDEIIACLRADPEPEPEQPQPAVSTLSCPFIHLLTPGTIGIAIAHLNTTIVYLCNT
jgi:hypothetical protein